jgi:para-nitrobenzyl esterase
MRQKPALDVMRQSVPNGNEVNGVDLRWTPVQDGITLKGDPDQLVQQGKFHRVPVIVGTTHDEGRLFVASEYHLANLAPVNEADVNAHIGRITSPDSALAARLRSTYTAQAYGTLDLAFSALLTDHYFACDAMRDAEAFSRHVPTYNYEFTEPSASNPDPLMPLGAFHGLELIYLFQNNQVMPESMDALSGAQLKLSEQMIRYWGRFAAMGHPNAFLPPYWPRFKARQPSSLNLNSKSLAVFGAAAFRKDHQCAVFDPN